MPESTAESTAESSSTGEGPTVAVVTGAGGGIGGACARVLADSHGLVVCVDRSPERARDTAAAIERSGGSAEPVTADAADPEFGDHVAAAASAFGPVRS